MLNFLRRPLFRKTLSLDLAGFKYDAFCLLIFGFVGFAFGPDFLEISSNKPQISVSAHDIRVLGVLGIYAPRISSFVAIARHNRQPQLIEWWITIIGLSFTVIMLVFGGFFELPYVSAHGYKYCFFSNDAGVYVKTSLPCPPLPDNSN